jgi:hypothetical protein
LVTTAVSCLLFVPVARGWYPYSAKYTAWQKERPFMMGALHNSVPEDRLGTRMGRFRAAGLNTVIWWKPGNALHIFRAAADQGLQWACGSVGGTRVIAEALKLPGCAFVMGPDEPSSAEELPKVAEICRWVQANHPELPVFSNLSIAKTDHDEYIRMCRPDIFSFDMYPLQRNGETQRHYLYNVHWGRRTAMQHRLPYWMFLQAYGREAEKASYAYRIPDEADTRFLVFSFLGHGGTGILFFHYYGHAGSMVADRGVENPGRGPVEAHCYENTVPSRAWYAVRDVAPEVRNLARALVNLRPKGEVMYAGNPVLWGCCGGTIRRPTAGTTRTRPCAITPSRRTADCSRCR